MSLKVKYLDIRHLKLLRIELHNIASQELLNELDKHIGLKLNSVKHNEVSEYLNNINHNRNGEYLCNIFSDKNMRELECLKENYMIMGLM